MTKAMFVQVVSVKWTAAIPLSSVHNGYKLIGTVYSDGSDAPVLLYLKHLPNGREVVSKACPEGLQSCSDEEKVESTKVFNWSVENYRLSYAGFNWEDSVIKQVAEDFVMQVGQSPIPTSL